MKTVGKSDCGIRNTSQRNSAKHWIGDKRKQSKINRTVTNLEQGLKTNGRVFDGAQGFAYLGALIN